MFNTITLVPCIHLKNTTLSKLSNENSNLNKLLKQVGVDVYQMEDDRILIEIKTHDILFNTDEEIPEDLKYLINFLHKYNDCHHLELISTTSHTKDPDGKPIDYDDFIIDGCPIYCELTPTFVDPKKTSLAQIMYIIGIMAGTGNANAKEAHSSLEFFPGPEKKIIIADYIRKTYENSKFIQSAYSELQQFTQSFIKTLDKEVNCNPNIYPTDALRNTKNKIIKKIELNQCFGGKIYANVIQDR